MRVVLDTNVLLRAFVNPESASGQVFDACEARQVVSLLSFAILREYRAVLGDKKIVSRFPQLRRREISAAIERLRYVSDLYRSVKAHFSYSRDPKDEPFIELAIEGNASHLITADQDMLSLPNGRDEPSRRFRQRLQDIDVLRPEEFVHRLGQHAL